MAWEWSHTAIAYKDAEKNFKDLPHEELAVIAAEWVAHDHAPNFIQEVYDKALDDFLECRNYDTEKLWRKIENLRTCDNGGFEAWVCPYGCHTVKFD
jgi:hypothetical protein